jgi:hypothetical protein
MASREELHALVDSLPEAAFEAAQQMLTRFQIWPVVRPPRPPEFERFREEARERFQQSAQGKPGFLGFGSGGNFDPTRGSGSAGTSFWEDDTLVAETLRLHNGHQLLIKERIRLDAGKTLIYTHSVEGPGNKIDQHEIRFDVVPNAPG